MNRMRPASALRILRKQRGFTLAEAGVAAGIGVTRYHFIETLQTPAREDEVARLAKVFNCRPKDLGIKVMRIVVEAAQ